MLSVLKLSERTYRSGSGHAGAWLPPMVRMDPSLDEERMELESQPDSSGKSLENA